MNSASFTNLWVPAQPIVSSYVFSSVRNSHDAEDLLQEIASAAFNDFAEFDQSRSFVAWVLGIAKYRLLTYYRSQSAQKMVFDESTLANLASAHEHLETQASPRRYALRKCLQRVDGKKRQVLQWRYAEDRSVASIAEQLNATPNAVSMMLYKSRKFLLQCIQRTVAAMEHPE